MLASQQLLCIWVFGNLTQNQFPNALCALRIAHTRPLASGNVRGRVPRRVLSHGKYQNKTAERVIFKTCGSVMCTAPELRRSQQSGQVFYGERQKRKKKRNSTAFLFNVAGYRTKSGGRGKNSKSRRKREKGREKEGRRKLCGVRLHSKEGG